MVREALENAPHELSVCRNNTGLTRMSFQRMVSLPNKKET